MPPPGRSSRGYKVFKNPPQPHMCIQDSIKGTSEKLYINVMSWKQIGNARQCADLIPLYGGMQILHGCNPNCTRPPLTVFAVMVNPEVLKVNGKYAPNPHERDALVSLSCDFVEAMNPGLKLTRRPQIMKDRDLAGELKDVWHAVQLQREKERQRNQEANGEVTHKIYHIDGPPDPDAADKADPMDDSDFAQNNCPKNATEEVNVKQEKKQIQPKQPSSSMNFVKDADSEKGDGQCELIISGPKEISKISNNFDNGQVYNDVYSKNINNAAESLNGGNHTQESNQKSNERSFADNIQLQSSNKIVPTISAPTALNSDDKDIPYVDEYHDNNEVSASVEGVFQNLSIGPGNNVQTKNVADAPLPNSFSDQRKVPLSSQQA